MSGKSLSESFDGRACVALLFVLAAGVYVQAAFSAGPQDNGVGSSPKQAETAPVAGSPLYEAHLWVGQTRLPGGQSETGLRSLELAVWPHDGLRLFLKHDDGLARDNAAVALSDRNAALNSVGVYQRWNGQTGSFLELGRRQLIDGGDRSLVHVKQSFYLSSGHGVDLGASLGRRNDGLKDWLAYLGGSMKVSPGWKLEPVLFVSRDGVPGNSEIRVHLSSQHELDEKWALGGGLSLGVKKATGTQQQVREGYLRATYRARPNLSLNLLARHESVERGDNLSVLSVGSTLEWR